MKKWITCFLILVCLPLQVGCTTQNTIQWIDGGVYQFVNADGEQSLAASLFGLSDLASVAQLETYDGSLNQAWRLHLQEDGSYKLECMSNGYYLTVYRNSKKEGAVVSVAAEKDSDSQKWTLEQQGKTIIITSVSSSLVLGIKEEDQNGEEETPQIVQQSSDSGKDQSWYCSMLDDGTTEFPMMLNVTGDIVQISCPEITKLNGVYYLFGDNRDGCGIRCSTDLITWEAIDNAYTYKNGYVSSWMTEDVENADMWCPGIYKIGDTYYIYYALTTIYSQRSTIAIFTNTTLDPDDPDYEWVDGGAVISSYKGDAYNCIDPCVITDQEGAVWLVFGSAWSGIKTVRLNAQTGKLLNPEDPELISVASRIYGDRAIEGSYMFYREGYYYLMAAVGIMEQGSYSNGIGRGESVTGPFYARDGVAMLDGGVKGGATLLTEEKEEIIMPGHCSVFEDEDGTWYFVLEYFPTGVDAKLGISTIYWDEEGWPWTALTPDVLSLGNGSPYNGK